MLLVDKDGSGAIDRFEFMSLLADILCTRNLEEEMAKVFRCYDNDDDGEVSSKNIYESGDLLEMEYELHEKNVEMMI